MPLRDDQYISLSPTDSPAEDAEMDSGAAAYGTPRTPGPKGVNFQQFCDQLRTNLPGDSQGRGSFDTRTRFVAGDPGARFGSAAPLEYEVTGEIGHPHWELVFEHVLRQCGYLTEFHTVYVMVDNRDLANHLRQDSSLPLWPAAARWWHSRPKLIGPHKEKTELLLFPISTSTGLHHVHPSWAGTFVLAALVAVFPGINFVLLDSDCLPVTLFEVHGVVVWSSTQNDSYPLQLIVVPGEETQRHLPETLHVETTGLEGRDLLYPIPWDISIRSDKEGQSIYGPSLAPMEETVDVPGIFGGTETEQVTALGRSKAAHEFLVLTLDWIAPSIGMHSCLTSCRRFSSRVPQPVGLLLWKCLEPRTLHRPIAECPTYCGPTQ